MKRCIRAVCRVLCLAWHLARGMAILRWRFTRLALQQRQAHVQAWSVGRLSIFGLKLKVSGAFSTLLQSVLVVSNQVSWLDIGLAECLDLLKFRIRQGLRLLWRLGAHAQINLT